MEDAPSFQDTYATSHRPPDTNTSGRHRSGSSGSIASKFPFLRTSSGKSSLGEQQSADGPSKCENASPKQPRALAAAISQQHKTRRRKGSLRKVVLLGRGVAREKREQKSQPQPQPQPELPQLQIPIPRHPTIDTSPIRRQQDPVISQIRQPYVSPGDAISSPINDPSLGSGFGLGLGLGLGLSDDTPRPSVEGSAPTSTTTVPAKPTADLNNDAQVTSPTISYTSTTDEEDGFARSLPVPALSQPSRASLSSSSESSHGPSHVQSPARAKQRRRSTNMQQYAKSPLSLQGLATGTPALATIDSGYHDYSETEWWGWVVLIVTWLVFIVGMGSCLNVWSWAWDVGSTPYAPPELEDDPTLPIVGYYPALMILTSIMAWVWVIVAWLGMKYFRHAKISGD